MSWSEILIVVVCAAIGFGMVFHFLQTREAEKKQTAEKDKKAAEAGPDGK